MSSGSTVLIATLPAVVAGAVGYFGARLQAKSSIRQAEVALEQLRAQYAEDHLRNRQGTYHQLLDSVRRLDIMVPDEQRPFGAKELHAWLLDFDHLANGAYLFGTEGVRAAITQLMAVAGSATGSDDDPRKAYALIRSEYLEAFRGLIDAMRADVAPPA